MNFSIGDYFFIREENDFVLYHLIAFQLDERFGAAQYWPSEIQPTNQNLVQFDLRNTCALLPVDILKSAVLVGNEPINSTDLEEYVKASRISEGLAHRKLELERLHKEALTHFESGLYSKAIDLYTELAPFDKLNSIIYNNRGKAFWNLGEKEAAQADFEFALVLDPFNIELKTLFSSCFKKS